MELSATNSINEDAFDEEDNMVSDFIHGLHDRLESGPMVIEIQDVHARNHKNIIEAVLEWGKEQSDIGLTSHLKIDNAFDLIGDCGPTRHVLDVFWSKLDEYGSDCNRLLYPISDCAFVFDVSAPDDDIKAVGAAYLGHLIHAGIPPPLLSEEFLNRCFRNDDLFNVDNVISDIGKRVINDLYPANAGSDKKEAALRLEIWASTFGISVTYQFSGWLIYLIEYPAFLWLAVPANRNDQAT